MATADHTERWLPIPGWEEFYEVSDLGRVRSLDRTTRFKDGRVRSFQGKILAQAADRDGYFQVMFKEPGRRELKKVHRLVLRAFEGPCPGGMQVRHLDGNPGNNQLGNLKYGTSSENHFDRVRHGTHTQKNRTHCPRGHLLAEPNLVPGPLSRGYRTCRACGRANAKIVRHPELKPKFKEISDYHYARILAA